MSTVIPKTMKAIQVEKTGGPEVNVMREVPVPTPKDDELLIKVEWTGANYIDNYRRSGLYKLDLPFFQGQDVVGTIVQLPKAAHQATELGELKLGQRVWSPVGASFAEYAAATWWKVAPLPDGVDPRDGVSMCTVALTAMALVRYSYAVKKGDYILVRAAAGGVGLVLCQLGKYLGAHVIATTSTEAKAKLAKENGAEAVLLTTASSEDNVKEILRLSEGRGVHAVFDGVGADTWEENFKVVRTNATIVTFGNASGPVPPFSPLKLSPKCLKVTRPTLFPFIANPEDFATLAKDMTDIVAAGGIKFAVHKEYPFTEEGVQQTQIDITGRGTTGKLLIHVA
ncbi:uncharacterized protein CcaverHIS019_0508610 [Cutaneotrichosporon cavernicola]|uniref:Probable quinone oxidoreductase n=1 Tax=Cutaneotrichosporon cavernicola TaxID=279322 RepID=A0AA48L783_9TREE|nr:uncharacterized protein CcaverHIS019_0508610 [Cutaneotrichosporon cavernicola]BEI93233.1 hypothetical protein CcaverHIS019_0508610 [Cutaneotrichosporon cavernicola]BEJ01010.1 hypothetical protein CcaverHIS631_0508670 [Cutaneotrichosporon cavernicola]BEJ08777.1 hypothetical protein CcaverHIS641_0508710 [Cutaneotrichosporon cavernicola]